MLTLPTREQVTAERDGLLDQLDTSSPVWKIFERILACDRYDMAQRLLTGTGDERTRGKAAYAEELMNFPTAQAARRKQKSE